MLIVVNVASVGTIQMIFKIQAQTEAHMDDAW
jgi:hypothetical protein